MISNLERIPQNGLAAVAARRGCDLVIAMAGYDWSTATNTVAKRSTFTKKHHGQRPEEAPYG